MKMPTIPKSMARQSVVIKQRQKDTDEYGKPIYNELSIDHVVVQKDPVYSGNGNNRELVANAVVFLYANVTSPMPVLSDTDTGNKIVYKDREYTIKRIVENLNPFSNDVWSYEVEVL